MAARAEMSTNAQGTEPQSSASQKGMAVALIGPNDAHRQVVARALSSGEGRKVHEFIDYPATLNDLARMMETRFDVVLVDVDTDESYALQIITKLAELGPAVMAYSARTDEDLVASCMRSGASDFLPLPTESEPPPAPAAPTARPAVTAAQPAPKPALPVAPSAPKPAAAAPPPAPVAPKPAPAVPAPAARAIEPQPWQKPIPPASRSIVMPMEPEKFAEPEADQWSSRVPENRPTPEPEDAVKALAKIETPKPEELDILKDDAKSDFAAWDAANLRRASMPPVARPDSRAPRPSLVPEKRKNVESITRVVPPADELVKEAPAPPPPPPAPAYERPPISSDIFRSSTFHAEPSEAAEKQGAKWMKWLLIAAGPVVLALVLLVVFTRSSTPNAASVTAKGTAASDSTPAPAPETPDPAANQRLIVNATGKPGDNVAAKSAKTNAAAGQAQVPAATAPTEASKDVSPDAMAEQLVAPTRIAGQIHTTAKNDEPPPSAPSAISLGDNGSMPGAVFGAGSKVKVAPRIVPISAGLAAGMLIHKTTPIYPKFAQDAHITGSVMMRATITKQGTIEGIQVVSGPKILAPAAVDAVKTWKYRPYMLDGQPVAVETDITVVFGGSGR